MNRFLSKLSLLAGPAAVASVALVPAAAQAGTGCRDTHQRTGNVPTVQIASVHGVSCATANLVANKVQSYHPQLRFVVNGRDWDCSLSQRHVPGAEDPVGVVACYIPYHTSNRVTVYLGA